MKNKTNTSKKEIEKLIEKTYDYTRSENLQDGKNLNSEIKRELAELAINADEKNKESFIVLNAYYNKYTLDSSFLLDKYFYWGDDFDYYIIDESNKYDFGYLFKEKYTLQKKKKLNE